MNASGSSLLGPVPQAVRLVGWGLLPGTAAFALRLFYEAFILPQPQMIFFSVVHLYPLLFVIAFASYVLAHVWVLLVVVRRFVGNTRWSLGGIRVLASTLSVLLAMVLVTVALVP